MSEAFALLLAYLVGSIPTGYVLTRVLQGADLRDVGSGGTGATNTSRALGTRWGVVVLVVDLLKGVAAVLLARALDVPELWVALAAAVAVVAHCFPVWLGFRGGKGVATGAGAAFALTPWGLILVPVMIVPIVVTRYVSLGSVLAAASAPPLLLVAGLLDLVPMEYTLFGVVAAAVVVGRHRGNIERLRAGTERRLGSRTDTAPAA